MPLLDILAIAACPALIVIYLRAANAGDRAEAAAHRRCEEIAQAYRQGFQRGFESDAAQVRNNVLNGLSWIGGAGPQERRR